MDILNSISSNVYSNLEAPIVFLGVAIGLRIANIVLGSIDALFKKDFNWGKFFSGVVKMLVVAIVILIVIIMFNLFTYGLSLIDVKIPQDTVDALQVILIVVTWCIDLGKEVSEKIKNLKDLKYVTYDDVTVNDYSVDERG